MMAIMGEKEEEGLIVNNVLLLSNEVEEPKENDGVTIEEIHEEEMKEEVIESDEKKESEADEGIRKRHVDFTVCCKVTIHNRSSSEPSLNASIPFFSVLGGGRAADRFILFFPFPISMIFVFFDFVEPFTDSLVAFSSLDSTCHLSPPKQTIFFG